jgi:uncharacterized integral membrane protein
MAMNLILILILIFLTAQRQEIEFNHAAGFFLLTAAMVGNE